MVYWLGGTVTVPAGMTLTVAAGQIVKFREFFGVSLVVEGTLKAVGTTAQPIIFTSGCDDAAGGDTRGDGQSLLYGGQWNAIQLKSGSSGNVIARADVRWGGAALNGMIVADNASVDVRNSIIQRSLTNGILTRNQAGLEAIDNLCIGNSSAGLRAEATGLLTAVNNTIDGNGWGVVVELATAILTNNLITYNTRVGVSAVGSAGVTASFNDVYNPKALNYEGLADKTGSDGNISADPKYFNRVNSQYQLRAGSIAIDSATSTGAPATDFLGRPRYDDPNILNVNGGGDTPYYDRGAFERQEISTADIDLTTSAVTAPAAALQDDVGTVAWTVTNLGPGTASGSWFDAVYLSVDDVFTPDDIFLSEKKHEGNVGPGQSYTSSAQAVLPGVLPGDYRIIVRANWKVEIFEGLALLNNSAAAAAPTAMDLPSLVYGSPFTGNLPATGSQRFYKLPASAGGAMTVSVSGPASAANELYLAFGALPSRQWFDERSNRAGSAQQTVSVRQTRAGNYYVMVYGASLPSAETFMLSAELAGFSIKDISPARGSNTGRTTIAVHGAQFDANSRPRLVDAAGQNIEPVEVFFVDSGLLAATFDLAGRPVGAADVQVVNAGNVATALPDGFQIIAGQPGRLVTSLTAPDRARLGRPIRAYIDYENVGNTDLLPPVLRLTAAQALTSLSLSPDMANSSSALYLLGTNPGWPAGVLPPGARGRITIYGVAHSPGFDDLRLEVGLFPSATVDWAAINAAIRPAGVDPAVWNAFFAQLQVGLSADTNQYLSEFAEAATLLPPAMGWSFSLADVFHLLTSRAVAVLNPSVSGRLFLDDLQHPLPNARLTLADAAAGNAYQAFSLNDGTFLFPIVAAGVYELSVDGFTTSSPVLVTITNSDVAIPARAVAVAGSISGGVLLLPAGIPLRAIPVAATSSDGRVLTATTRDDGSFELNSMPGGSYTLTAGGGEYTVNSVGPVVVGPGEPVQHVMLPLRMGSTISGRAISPAGPLPASAIVYAQDSQGAVVSSVVPSDDGSYTIGSLPAGTYRVTAQVAGLLSATQTGLVLAENAALSNVNLNLASGGGIRGTLKAQSTGQGLPGEFIVVRLHADYAVLAQTDSAGDFSVAGLPPGLYSVSAAIEGLLPVSADVTVVASQAATVALVVGAAGQITGVVRDSAGQSLSDTLVTARDAAGHDVSTTTDDTGRYSIRNLPLGSYTVLLGNADNGGCSRHSVALSAASPDATADLVLGFIAALSGTVFDHDGTTGLEGATVQLLQSGLPVASAVTDAAGKYTIRLLAPGTYDLIAFGDHTFEPRTGIQISAANPVVTVDFGPASGSLSATVTDEATGQPIAGAEVLVLQQLPGLEQLIATVTTGADGRYIVAGLPAGSYRVFVMAAGHAFAQTVISVGAGAAMAAGAVSASAASGDIILGAPTTIAGNVCDGTGGQPVANATVYVKSQSSTGPVAMTTTNENGDYAVTGLPAGSWDVVVAADARQQSTTTGVTTSAAKAAVVNPSLGPALTRLQGQISSAGMPVNGAFVVALDSVGNTVGQTNSLSDGSYVFEGLPPGDTVVQVMSDGNTPHTTDPVAVLTNRTVSLTVPLDEPAAQSPQGFWNTASSYVDWISEQPVRGIEWLVKLTNKIERDPDQPRSLPDLSGCPDKAPMVQRYFRWAEIQFQLWQDAQANYLPKIGEAEKWGNFAIAAKDIVMAISPWLKLLAKAKENLEGMKTLFKAPRMLKDVQQALQVLDYVGFSNKVVGTIKAVATAFDYFVNGKGNSDSLTFACVTAWDRFSDLVQYAATKVEAMEKLGPIFKFGLGPIFSIIKAFRSTETALSERLKINADLVKAKQQYENRQQEYRHSIEMLKRAIALFEWCKNKRNDPRFNAPPPPPPAIRVAASQSLNNRTSFDPNDKIGPKGYGDARFIQPGPMPFEVQFENDPKFATAPAQEVFVTDPLDTDLDLATFEFVGFGFGSHKYTIPSGLSHYETTIDLRPFGVSLLVPVVLDLNMSSRQITATYRSLDPLTGLLPDDIDAGFLPVNNANHDGEGYFSYQVRPKADLASGTQITNKARIVFDVNAPIDTPMTLNTLDVDAPSSQISALPSISLTAFEVAWTGSDAAGGSGIAGYDVYVSENGQPYWVWLANTALSQETFQGTAGASYAFYSIARDNVGNVEAAPPAPDAHTTVAGTMTCQGGPGDDQFTIRLDATGAIVQALVNQNPSFAVPLSQLTKLNLDGGGGLDTLTIDLGNGNPLGSSIVQVQSGYFLLTIANGPTALRTGGLAITQSATLNLADNDLIVQNGDIGAIAGAIKSGRLIGKGEEYTTLAAILNDKGDKDHTPIKSSFAGQTVLATDVLVKYTWDGDANLDGIINADDYFQIDSGYITQAKGYQNGDFNYDGVINADDYFLIDSAFIGQSGPLAASKPEPAMLADMAVQQKARKTDPDGILSQLFSTEPVL
ncbi:MAG: carboxypeptidase regulatory-like domain-containing protein [Planctomycetota bacterium]|nr:carboxypeptidase regulatory-like domain-containing protein [Planctomycetota bacterium]